MANSQSTITCPVCGTAFQVWPVEIKRGRRFCSLACRKRWMSAPLHERLKRYIGEKDENGCILWNRGRNYQGYGRIRPSNDNANSYAHRVAWELANGRPIPEGLEILHTCDNPPCVNPEHLVLDTHLENMAGSALKCRMAHKVSNEEVVEIRSLYAEGKLSQREIGLRFGIKQAQVSRIINRKRRKYIYE